MLRDMETGGERNRSLFVLKSRGMAHSNQIREFLLTDQGVDLVDVYVGPAGVLTGSMRLAQEAEERRAEMARQQDLEILRSNLEKKRRAMEAQIAALQAQFAVEEEAVERAAQKDKLRKDRLVQDHRDMAVSRKTDHTPRRKGR
jgi:circadian clock protein KaiC